MLVGSSALKAWRGVGEDPLPGMSRTEQRQASDQNFPRPLQQGLLVRSLRGSSAESVANK